MLFNRKSTFRQGLSLSMSHFNEHLSKNSLIHVMIIKWPCQDDDVIWNFDPCSKGKLPSIESIKPGWVARSKLTL